MEDAEAAPPHSQIQGAQLPEHCRCNPCQILAPVHPQGPPTHALQDLLHLQLAVLGLQFFEVEVPGVSQRDHVGEALQDGDILLGELVHLRAVHSQGAIREGDVDDDSYALEVLYETLATDVSGPLQVVPLLFGGTHEHIAPSPVSDYLGDAGSVQADRFADGVLPQEGERPPASSSFVDQVDPGI